MNGKADVGLLMEIIRLRLEAPPLDRCRECAAAAVEVLYPFHPYVPPYGLCACHLRAERAAHLL